MFTAMSGGPAQSEAASRNGTPWATRCWLSPPLVITFGQRVVTLTEFKRSELEVARVWLGQAATACANGTQSSWAARRDQFAGSRGADPPAGL